MSNFSFSLSAFKRFVLQTRGNQGLFVKWFKKGDLGLLQEQDEWFQREQELLQRIEEVGEKNAKILQMEKVKLPALATHS